MEMILGLKKAIDILYDTLNGMDAWGKGEYDLPTVLKAYKVVEENYGQSFWKLEDFEDFIPMSYQQYAVEAFNLINGIGED